MRLLLGTLLDLEFIADYPAVLLFRLSVVLRKGRQNLQALPIQLRKNLVVPEAEMPAEDRARGFRCVDAIDTLRQRPILLGEFRGKARRAQLDDGGGVDRECLAIFRFEQRAGGNDMSLKIFTAVRQCRDMGIRDVADIDAAMQAMNSHHIGWFWKTSRHA